MMKYFSIAFVALIIFLIIQDDGQVESRVYNFTELVSNADELKGKTAHLEHLEFTVEKLSKGENAEQQSASYETLIIVKSGELGVGLGDSLHQIGWGSVALILPEESYTLSNEGEEEAVYYLMEYRSKNPVNLDRGRSEGGSFVIDFEDLEFNEHDRGGIRNYYNRPTAMMEYFEMHVTNLNGLIKSHEPHTHGAAEIVLMISGDTEMEIGDGFYKAYDGDVYFLESEIPHAIENLDENQAMYFAFQWE